MCPFPQVHGNRARFAALLRWLKKKEFAVTFILQPLDVEDRRGLDELSKVVDRLDIVRPQAPPWALVGHIKRAASATAQVLLPGWIATRLRRGGRAAEQPRTGTVIRTAHIDDWCWPTTCEAVRRAVAREKPIAVVTEYALLSKCLEDVPSTVLKVIDTVEVFFRNSDRFQTDGLEAPLVCTPTSEKHALARADVLVAIQKNDARALRELFPTKTVITVPHSCRRLRRRHSPDAGTILYVGSSNPFNVHGLREFLHRAWPEIVTRVPQATLRIVGSIPRVDGTDHPGILHVGRVTDQQLAREYQTANVVINPQVAGTGLKIKCVEALSAGCPLVTNAAGADGLEDGAGSAYLLANGWNDFARHVVTLLTDAEARRVVEAQARVFADRLFSPGAAFRELEAVLSPLRSRP